MEQPSKTSRVIRRATAALIGLPLGALLLALLSCPVGLMAGRPELILPLVVAATVETQWAPGFSAHAYAQVRPGDSPDRVRSLLGEPLRRSRSEGRESWEYTRSPRDTHYWERVVVFSRGGVVTGTHSELYWD
jgi:outer membrane protein assembly factor BamE (lipoprotein component of BamABCDE complex)